MKLGMRNVWWVCTLCVVIQGCDASAVDARVAGRSFAFEQAASSNDGNAKLRPIAKGFVRVPLDRGILVDLPQSFRVLSMGERRFIKAIGEAAAEKTNMPKNALGDNLVRANSTPATTYAAISLTSVTPSTVNYDEAKNMTQSEVTADVEEELKANFVAMLGAVGQQVKSFYGVRVERFGPHPALVQEYERTAPNGQSVVVQVNSIFTPFQELRLTLSYRRSEAARWRPLLAKVRSSLVISR